jgi:general secretion pathway protein J
MTRRRARISAATAGFTLIEALVATALMGIVLVALSSLAGQWLPNWNRGIARAQSSELIGVALDRLVGDVAGSQFVTPNRDSKVPLFDGTPSTLVFVRSALGPNARPGLEIVRIAEMKDGNGAALVRSTAPFTPLPMNGMAPALPPLADPIVLLRSAYRVSFAFAGSDGEWKDAWQNVPQLPSVVRVTLRDGVNGRPLSVSTAALVHVDMPVSCLSGADRGQEQGQGQAQAQAQLGQDQAGQVPGLGQVAQGAQVAQANRLAQPAQDGSDCNKGAPQDDPTQQQDDADQQNYVPAARSPRRDM